MRISQIVLKKLINGRTGGAAALIFAAILSFTVFSGNILLSSLLKGSDNLKERLGADIAVVPAGEEANYQGIILSGEPVDCSIERKLEDRLRLIEGVDKVTPVVYLASLNASCCSVPIQIIGFDPETDFVTTPWISGGNATEYDKGSIVVGANIAENQDGTLTFFGRTYEVRARLNKTGTGMDKSVYITFDAMEQMILNAREKGVSFGDDSLDIAYGSNITDSFVSAFLIRVKEGYDSDLVAGAILKDGSVGVVQSKNVLNSVTRGIGVISDTIKKITFLVMILVILVTAILHIYRINNRKKEWAVYRMMGASEDWIVKLIFAETVLLSLIGAALGIGFGALTVFSFSDFISSQLRLPYYRPDVVTIILGVAFSTGLTILSGALPGILAGIVASRTECYVLMREGEN